MPRRSLIAGNWKMHTNLAEARELAMTVVKASRNVPDRDVMIAPPFTSLNAVAEVIKGSRVKLSSQNVCWEEKGAFTGEISPTMLKESGCVMAIVGHSERRHVFGESDEIINNRVKGAMKFDLTPVFCVGETLEQRENGKTLATLETQIHSGLKDVAIKNPDQLVIAYEPVWAIGTGKTATVEQAQEAHEFVRNLIEKLYEKSIASKIRILYGGSVNQDNVDSLMQQTDVDGALVGGASLKAESFSRIINFQ